MTLKTKIEIVTMIKKTSSFDAFSLLYEKIQPRTATYLVYSIASRSLVASSEPPAAWGFLLFTFRPYLKQDFETDYFMFSLDWSDIVQGILSDLEEV